LIQQSIIGYNSWGLYPFIYNQRVSKF